ncbi:hypothetical protein THAOC_31997 [Thalassiosira oceanica]|uniref:B30.2/SPRY domain-containing protein n=1 Tax=Thalassiosira oceanica TaxID=159749 RepID=K0RR74_THAOC|nr:hypothetical protein THAOC_31997 [Thalassiosira oceanica]|eukprot:EJK49157.1 hypothetical protein THAOC_31997 [Thalassiosira oceanica]
MTKFREEKVRSPETDTTVRRDEPASRVLRLCGCGPLKSAEDNQPFIVSASLSQGLLLASRSDHQRRTRTAGLQEPAAEIRLMEPRNKRARLPTAALDVLDNDLLVRCASYLDADGLAQLGRTSARFGIPQAGQERSIANEAANQQFRESATDEERSRLPKYDDESDVDLLRALEQLRQPLCFDELAGYGLSLREDNPASVTRSAGRTGWSTAMSGHPMRGGRHFVEFEITNEQDRFFVNLGVVRPVSLTDGIDFQDDWVGTVNAAFVSSSLKPAVAEKLRSQRTAKWGESNVHCCAYFCSSGRCLWADWDTDEDYSDWLGQERLESGGTIGLLLDLDEGTLSVFKNGRRLGVIKEGLGGEYCWFVAACRPCTISISRDQAPN